MTLISSCWIELTPSRWEEKKKHLMKYRCKEKCMQLPFIMCNKHNDIYISLTLLVPSKTTTIYLLYKGVTTAPLTLVDDASPSWEVKTPILSRMNFPKTRVHMFTMWQWLRLVWRWRVVNPSSITKDEQHLSLCKVFALVLLAHEEASWSSFCPLWIESFDSIQVRIIESH